jgi:hypothetical protein
VGEIAGGGGGLREGSKEVEKQRGTDGSAELLSILTCVEIKPRSLRCAARTSFSNGETGARMKKRAAPVGITDKCPPRKAAAAKACMSRWWCL